MSAAEYEQQHPIVIAVAPPRPATSEPKSAPPVVVAAAAPPPRATPYRRAVSALERLKEVAENLIQNAGADAHRVMHAAYTTIHNELGIDHATHDEFLKHLHKIHAVGIEAIREAAAAAVNIEAIVKAWSIPLTTVADLANAMASREDALFAGKK
jgi:hypothetical protein